VLAAARVPEIEHLRSETSLGDRPLHSILHIGTNIVQSHSQVQLSSCMCMSTAAVLGSAPNRKEGSMSTAAVLGSAPSRKECLIIAHLIRAGAQF